MSDIEKKIKESKTIIKESKVNNPNELYNKVLKNQKEKIYNFRYSVSIKYAFMLLLILVVSISSIAIYKSVDVNEIDHPIEEVVDEEIKNIKSVDELQNLIKNSYTDSSTGSSSGAEWGSTSLDPGIEVVPLPSLSYSSSSLTGDINLDRVYGTNVQETNVDEADIVKVNGQYIYYIPSRQKFNTETEDGQYQSVYKSNECVYILKAINDSVEIVKKIKLDFENKLVAENNDVKVYEKKDSTPKDLYYTENYLIVRYSTVVRTFLEAQTLISYKTKYMYYTDLLVYDINSYELVKSISLPGTHIGTRLIGDDLYVISNYKEYKSNGIYLPIIYLDNTYSSISINDIYYCPALGMEIKSYTNIFKVSLNKDNIVVDNLHFISPYISNIYVTNNAIYLIKNYSYSNGIEEVSKVVSKKSKKTRWPIAKVIIINIEDELKFDGCIQVKGQIGDSYWIDEHNGYLRIATSGLKQTSNLLEGIYEYNPTTQYFNYLTIFEKNEEGSWKEISIVKNIGELGEQIKSVRFTDNAATIVTFKITDPLYYIDLSDPYKPVITSALKIPGFSTYQHPYKDNYVIGFGYDTSVSGITLGYKIALFDISDKENVIQVGKELTYSNSTYYDFSVLTSPKNLFLDLSNNIFGCGLVRDGGNVKFGRYTRKQYISCYNIYKIDINNKEEPIQVLKTIERVDNNCLSISLFDRMVFIGDKYYLLSFDKVYMYKLTNEGLNVIGEKELPFTEE